MKKLIRFHFQLIFVLSFFTVHTQVVINEYSASNLNDFPDNFNKFEDWIELYNLTGEVIDLSGWYLSDKLDKPTKWEIPSGTTIEPNGYLVFWCSGRDMIAGGQFHTNFKLTQTKGNEILLLTDPTENVLQKIPMELTLLGQSQCRDMDGFSTWKICVNPSLGSSNNGTEKYDGFTATPTMNLEAGFYIGQQSVSINYPDTHAVVRYTVNGFEPTMNSPEYTSPILLSQTQVVKARAFPKNANILPGKIAFNTYFINENSTLPVFSIGSDQIQDLANGQGDLRPIGSLEYFNVDKERTAVSYGEMNRHGQDSWVNPHRSLDWISRDEMGYNKAVLEKLFTYSDRDEYQRFMFRASGDDNYPAIDDWAHEGSTHVRDEYVHALALEGGMELDVRAVERVLVFLNGAYWGVYGLRERPADHDYTNEYYDQDKYHLQYIATWGGTWAEYGGDSAIADWKVLRDFIMQNDMGDSTNYQIVKDNINLVSMIDYMIANLNSVASDWMNYNTGWWRGLNPEGGHLKWGYILWDNDATFDYYINYSGVPNTDPDAVPCDIEDISDYMDQFWSNPENNVGKHEKIFLKLQEENEEFRQLYYSRHADLMNTVYTCDNMLSTLDSMIQTIAPEMPRQIQRWGGSMQEWIENVGKLRGFLEERCTLLDDGMVECFDITGPFNITLMTEPAGVGTMDLNTISLENLPWSGDYFGNMDNLLTVKPFDDKLTFKGWESKGGTSVFADSSLLSTSVQITEVDTLVAVFGTTTNTRDFEEVNNFKIYPTIVEEVLNVEFQLDQSTEFRLSVFSILGEKLTDIPYLTNYKINGTYREQIDVHQLGLDAGFYVLHLQTGNKKSSAQFAVMD